MTKIYDITKTQELNLGEIDLDNGRLINKMEIIHHQAIENIEEKGHYEVVAEYPNGGRDIRWVVDTEAQEGRPEYDETIEYQIYVPYSIEFLHNRDIYRQIDNLKQALSDTDYKILKRFEGYYTDEEFEEIKLVRRQMRDSINELEAQLYQTVPEDNGEIY